MEGARSLAAAKKVASSIANSQLVKTAFFGEDPNFRQIMAAIGCAAFPLTVQRWMFLFNGVTVVKRGVGMPLKEREAARVLRRPSFEVKVRLGQGKQATPSARRIYLTNTCASIQLIAREMAWPKLYACQ